MIWWQKKPIIDLVNGYEKISLREQKIVLVGIVSSICILAFMLVVEPIFISYQELDEKFNDVVELHDQIENQLEETLTRKLQDPNVPLREELAKLEASSQALDDDIGRLTKALVAPRQMVLLLENMLQSDKNIKLISLVNLPKEDVIFNLDKDGQYSGEDATTDKNTEVGVIYKHTFEIEMKATYDSTVNYLKRIDSLEWKVFWQQLNYEIKQYPNGILKIKIYTLSTSKEVLGV
jgi:MSHA biogenesis protein MshJ